jgi:hypothetical protein
VVYGDALRSAGAEADAGARRTLLSNRAACRLKLGQLGEAVADCEELALGEAAVAHANRMAKATFRTVREVKALNAPGEPALALVLAPRVEEFAFVTPRDAGGSLYQVTLRFRMNVHDSQGRLVDSLVYTGYGATGSGSGLSSEGPLTAATELALRDAGAKFLTEFPLQPVVQQVLRGEAPVPVPQSVPLPSPESPKETL